MSVSFEQEKLPGSEIEVVMPQPVAPPSPEASAKAASSYTEIPRSPSQAESDQVMWRGEWGVPVGTDDRPVRTQAAIDAQNAANKKRWERAKRGRETKHTGGGRTETQASDPAYSPLTELATPASSGSPGRLAARRVAAAIEAVNIINRAGNDPALSMALARSRQEKR